MTSPVDDPNWPRLLALAVHEFRTPMTVVAGYIRMLLKDRAGPLTDQQRRLLEEAEKSCVRLSGLLGEMSELSSLEAGTATFNRSEVDLRAVLHDAVATLPAVPERDVSVELSSGTGRAIVHGDPVRLKSALTAVLVALRRELVTSNRLFVRDPGERPADVRIARRARLVGRQEPESGRRLGPACRLTRPKRSKKRAFTGTMGIYPAS
ncbi:MAG: hypothetical protein LC753_01220 [Acidobacteria bacterium]|nr:hypothetical protein [Acidobacteriota bacterium]